MTIPTLRFKADDSSKFGEWKSIQLKDIAERIARKNKEENQNALTISAQMGLVNQQAYFSKQIASRDLSKYYLLHKGEYAYNKSYSAGYPMGAIKRLKLYEKGVVSTLYICFSLNKQVNSDFFEQYVESGNLVPELEKIAQEGARNHGLLNISLQEFFEINLIVPCLKEQMKIATFLSAVDKKISQLSQKLHLLGQYKQGMMQKLFSQQLRFKADDGSEFEREWESKTLGEVGENIIGLTYSPTDVTNDGSGILVLRSSNIKNGRLDKNDQVRVNKKIKEKIIVQPNDILICTRNGSQRLIGKSVILNDDEVMTFGAFMSVYRSRSNRFIAYLMQTPWFFEQVQMNLGARINQITTGTLNEFTFDFPCFEEQTKIADFLSSIDQKIDVVSEQLKQAKLWKKGLLQQMFV